MALVMLLSYRKPHVSRPLKLSEWHPALNPCSIHGLTRSAVRVIEKGHPCGIPRFLVCSCPYPTVSVVSDLQTLNGSNVWLEDPGWHPCNSLCHVDEVV